MGLKELQAIKANAGLPKPKKNYTISKVSKKRAKQLEEQKKMVEQKCNDTLSNLAAGIPGLAQWFEDRMAESTPVCMNCGMEASWLLDPQYKKIWKACQAHVLPKKLSMFPSVATHPLNHMVLFPVWGGYLCGCHDEYDSGWYNATTMKVWDIALHRFKEFESAIATTERRKIPEQFITPLL